ncbi:protein kinase domain-containing protein [Planctomycetaceae bacterium SH139]
MNEDVIATSGSLVISKDTLRAFAKGQLDEAAEQQVLALLETRPDLAAQVAAISSDSMLERMKSHGEATAPKSLSSQLASADQAQTDAKSAKAPPKFPPELAELTGYRILKEIGRGGMGVVYLAEHLLTGRKEVLKVLNERLMTNAEARKRFDQEIKCVAAMNHETIVRCYTVQQLPSALVLCMEYIPGTNLHSFINTNGPLPIHVACGIASEVCRGLQHAMDNGLVHRDIKPSNIMLYKAEGKIKAKILDFGLARLNTREKAKGLTDDGTLLGTLEYIAPEQCLNAAAADIQSDIYSLGCTLYHMLVGHPPFRGSSGELVLAHAQSVPPAINLARPEVPSELAGLISKMLAKQPGQRQQKPLNVADDLTPFLRRRNARQAPSQPPATSNANNDTSVELHYNSNTAIEPKPGVSLEPTSLPRLIPSPKQKKAFPKRAVLTAGALVFLAAFGLYGLNVKTKHGTLVFKNLPDNALVIVDNDEVKIEKLPQGDTVVRVEPGSRQIKVVANNVTVVGQTVSIESGEEVPIEISLESKVGAPVAESAATNEVQSIRSHESPWIPIFQDGVLTRNVSQPSAQGSAGFVVQDGFMIPTNGRESVLVTTADLANFRCRIQYQVTGKVAPRLLFRSAALDGESYSVSLSVSQLNAPAYVNGPDVEPFAIADNKLPEIAENEWHELELEAIGPTFSVRSNGKLAYSFEDPRLTSGKLALQCEESELPIIKIRKFEYQRELVPADTPWQPIFTDGEIAPETFLSCKSEVSVHIRDGMLVGQPARGQNLLLTEGLHSNIRMRLEYRIMEPNRCRIVLRARERQGGYGISLINLNKASFAPKLCSPNFDTLEVFDEIAISEYDWHTVEVVAIGDQFYVFFNNEFLYKFSDSRRSAGVSGIQFGRSGVQFRRIEYQVLPD